MSFSSTPPLPQSFRDTKPTLLVAWWCTIYALTVIIFRIGGRYVRAEKLFRDDAVMLLAILPLLLRMACTHVVLLFGTNNVLPDGLGEGEISRRELGSRVVLLARAGYILYLWTIKFSISIFLRTLTASVWRTSHQKYLRYLHIFLFVTLLGALLSDLIACQPFTTYWQVVPLAPAQCRQGYAQLLTTGTLNVVTNLALVGFPLPMILRSSLLVKQKCLIILQLSLPLLPSIFTLYHVPLVIHHLGAQPFRSLLASIDILISTFVANALVLGSLLQDRGYKKTKYKHGNNGPISNATASGGPNADLDLRRAITGERALGTSAKAKITRNQWGSDEDLMSEVMQHYSAQRDVASRGIDASVARDPGKAIHLEQLRTPTVPARMKFPEIRVASTWEVQVDEAADLRR